MGRKRLSRKAGLKMLPLGNSLMVRGLELCMSPAGGMGWIPGWGTKVLLALEQYEQK